MTPAVDPTEEMYDVLFRIVHQHIVTGRVRRTAILPALRLVRRADPERYSALLKRRHCSGLPPVEDEEETLL